MTRLKTLALTTSLLAALASPLAHAHSDAYLDTLKAPHGGQTRMAGALHLELVLDKEGTDVKERPIVVYVSDHAEQPQASTGATGSVTLLMGKTKVSVPLKADGDNRLTAKAKYASLPGIKAIVTVTLPGQESQQARFTPVSTRPETADGHTSHKH